jgi:hypothetical protein
MAAMPRPRIGAINPAQGLSWHIQVPSAPPALWADAVQPIEPSTIWRSVASTVPSPLTSAPHRSQGPGRLLDDRHVGGAHQTVLVEIAAPTGPQAVGVQVLVRS